MALAIASLTAVGVHAATKAKPAAAPIVVSPAQKTSALFFTVCAESMGSQVEFNKHMQALGNAKVAVKMAPDQLKGINAEEAKNAWATKGFADENKPLVLVYNAAQNTCGMHVSDTDTTELRQAFQGDLKKMLDKTKGTVTVYKPQIKGTLKAYGADIMTKDKTLQFGIAISKSGEAFLTIHV